MIKECKVLSYNKFLNILVFDYDGKQIQTTVHLDSEFKTVFVDYRNGKYKIVSKNEYDKYIQENKKKEKRMEKTNTSIVLENIEGKNEN